MDALAGFKEECTFGGGGGWTTSGIKKRKILWGLSLVPGLGMLWLFLVKHNYLWL